MHLRRKTNNKDIIKIYNRDQTRVQTRCHNNRTATTNLKIRFSDVNQYIYTKLMAPLERVGNGDTHIITLSRVVGLHQVLVLLQHHPTKDPPQAGLCSSLTIPTWKHGSKSWRNNHETTVTERRILALLSAPINGRVKIKRGKNTLGAIVREFWSWCEPN